MRRSSSQLPVALRGRELSYSFRVLGGRRLGWRDAYHAMLKMPWWSAIALIVFGYLLLNALFQLTIPGGKIGGLGGDAVMQFLEPQRRFDPGHER